MNCPAQMTIWKYKLQVGANCLRMPEGSRVLTAAVQDGDIQLWAIIPKQDSYLDRTIMVYGTGWPIEDPLGHYIATAISGTGKFVWHVFEVMA